LPKMIKFMLLLFVALCAIVCAESLREGISAKIMVKSSLYDAVPLADPIPFDLGNGTNITQPTAIWNTLPDWLRYVCSSA